MFTGSFCICAVNFWMSRDPQGIQQVNFNGYVTGKIYIPESVTTLLDDFIMVTQGYEVAEGNPYFCSVDGFLYNKAKTELLGIPVGLEEIDIPEDVTSGHSRMEFPDKDKFRITNTSGYQSGKDIRYTANWYLQSIMQIIFLHGETVWVETA